MGRSNNNLLIVLLSAVTFLSGCALPRNPVPVDKMSIAKFVTIEDVRSVGLKYTSDPNNSNTLPQNCSVLALSGGGSDGAFGAGFLCGWTQTGKRPSFDMVTGISTGALIAPLVFLGPEYDRQLKKAYTTITANDIFSFFALSRESFVDTWPLQKKISQTIDQQVLDLIAEEHNKGRRLYIGTTNLDSQSLIVWDMGKIAASGNKDALKLFRKIMLASASIPGLFAPVYFEVEIEGVKYDEMHVDGGVIMSVFGYGPLFEVKTGGGKRSPEKNKLYIIYNGQAAAKGQQVKRNLPSIIPRALLTLTKSHAWGDLYRLYTIAEKNGIDFNYICIPDNYTPATDTYFDNKEMNKVFDLGFEMGRGNCKWSKTPPGLDTNGS